MIAVASRSLELLPVKPFRGVDVREVQRAANARLRARGEGRYVVVVDGQYGPLTARACSRALYLLGATGTRLERSKVANGGHLSVAAQRMIRLETRRSAAQLARAQARKVKIAARPLRVRALDEAREALGRHIFETGGNNRGPQVEAIIEYAHGQVPEPWCVDFDIWCYGHAGSTVVRPGFPRAVRLMLTAGTREGAALAGRMVRYTFDHTGIFVCWCNSAGQRRPKLLASHIKAIEGNTGAAGAVSDGNGSDGVYEKVRARSLVQDFLYARA